MDIIFYTDGACKGNPGPGGCAFITLIDGKTAREWSRGYVKTTNNRMELKAVCAALGFAKNILCHAGENSDSTVTIYSDSQLVVSTFNDGWARKSNLDLWTNLDTVLQEIKGMGATVTFIKVKGHADDALNNQVDRLAVAASQNPEFFDMGYNSEPVVSQQEVPASPAQPAVDSNTVTIEQVALNGFNSPDKRFISVFLSNGTVVAIAGYMGGFTQYGCTEPEARLTQPVAERFTEWLNGGEL